MKTIGPLLSVQGAGVSKAELLNAVQKIPYTGGETDLAAGATLAVDNLKRYSRPDVQSLILLFSDGHSRNSWSQVLLTSQEVQRTKAEVYVVSYGTKTNYMELELYAGSRGRIYDGPRSAKRFMDDFRSQLGIESEACHSPVKATVRDIPDETYNVPTKSPSFPSTPYSPIPSSSFSSSSPSSSTWSPSVAPSVDLDCSSPAVLDLLLLIDVSSSIQDEFEDQKAYAGRVVKALYSVKGLETRVGVISYSERALLELELASGQSREAVLEVIRNIGYVGRATNTSAAAALAVRQLEQRTSRRPSFVLLLNDGQSQDSWDVVRRSSQSLRQAADEIMAVTLSPTVYFPELIYYTGSQARIYDNNGANQLIYDLQRHPFVIRPECEKDESFLLPPLIVPSQDPCAPLDVFVIFDTSGSLDQSFSEQKDLAVLFLDSLPANSRIGVAAVRFGGSATLDIPLQDKISRNDLRAFLDLLENTGGSTSLASAVDIALRELKRHSDPTRRPLVAIFSDGKSGDDEALMRALGGRLRDSGALVLAASLSPFVTEEELFHYTGSKDNIFLGDRAPEMLDLVGDLRQCESDGPKIPAKPECDLDIVFTIDAVDRNGSFERHIERTLSLLDSLPIMSGRLRVGIISFGKAPTIVHGLRDYTSPELIQSKLKGLKATGDSETSIRDGLRLAMGEALASRRPSAAAAILLMANGESSDPWHGVKSLSRQLLRHRFQIYAMADLEHFHRSELLQYTRDPSALYLGPVGFSNLRRRMSQLVSESPCPLPLAEPTIDLNRDCSRQPLDLVFIVDPSPDQLRQAGYLIQSLPDDVSVAIISVQADSEVLAPFSIDRSAALRKLEEMRPLGGERSISRALAKAREALDPRGVDSDKAVLVLGAGEAYVATEKTLADVLGVADVLLVRTTGSVPADLADLAAASAGRVKAFDKEAAFLDELGSLVELSTCSQLRPTASACKGSADIVIVLDASGSVADAFEAQLAVAKELVESLPLDEPGSEIAVSIIRYSDAVDVFQTLETDLSRSKLLEELDSMAWLGGRTETGMAISRTLDELEDRGRPDATPILLLFHDGYSQDPWEIVKQHGERLSKIRGLQRFVVAMSENTYDPELLLYAAHPNSLFRKNDKERLRAELKNAISRVCDFRIDAPPEVVPMKPQTAPTTSSTTSSTTSTTSSTSTSTTTTTPAPASTTAAPTTPRRPTKTAEDECKKKLEVIFLLDSSGSNAETFEQQRTIALDLLGMLPLPPESDNVRVGLIEFSERHRVLLRPSEASRGRADTLAALNNIRFTGGNTATADAVAEAIDLIEENRDAETKYVVILLNDGHSQDPWKRVDLVGRQLREAADEVFAVALSEDVYLPELLLYTEEASRVYRADSVSEFVKEIQHLLGDLNECAVGTLPGMLEECGPADILFLMDTTGTVGLEGLAKEKELILGAVERLPLNLEETRVAVAQFAGASQARLEFPFDAHDSMSEVREALNSIGLGPIGLTRLERALFLARSLFVPDTGSRKSAQKVVVMLTDGYSLQSPEEAAAELRLSGVTVFALGVRRHSESRLNPGGLLDIAGSGERVFIAGEETTAFYQRLAELTKPCS